MLVSCLTVPNELDLLEVNQWKIDVLTVKQSIIDHPSVDYLMTWHLISRGHRYPPWSLLLAFRDCSVFVAKSPSHAGQSPHEVPRSFHDIRTCLDKHEKSSKFGMERNYIAIITSCLHVV
jgi:hypothetical protein